MTARGNDEHDAPDSAPTLQINGSTSGFGGSDILVRKNETAEVWQHIATGGGIITNGKGSHFLMTAAHSLPGYQGPQFPQPQISDKFEFNMDDLSDDEEPDELGVDSTSLGSRTPPESRCSSTDDLSSRTSHSEEIISSQISFLEQDWEASSEIYFPVSTSDQQAQALPTQGRQLPLYTAYSKAPFITSSESYHPELDYALIEMNRIEIDNNRRLLETGPTRVLYKPEPREVVVTTSSHGRTKGRLLETPLSIIRSDSTEAQELWTVILDNDTIKGDSGSWVYDATSGELVGHIVAASTETGSTLIIPAFQVLEDLQQRFGGCWRPITDADGILVSTSTAMAQQSPGQQTLLPEPSTLAISCPIAATGASDNQESFCVPGSAATFRRFNQGDELEIPVVADTTQPCNSQANSSTSSWWHCHSFPQRLKRMSYLPFLLSLHEDLSHSTAQFFDDDTDRSSSSGRPAAPNENCGQHTISDPIPSRKNKSTKIPNIDLAGMLGASIPEESVGVDRWIADDTFAMVAGNLWETEIGAIDQINEYQLHMQSMRGWLKPAMQSANEKENAISRKRWKSTTVTDTPGYVLNIPQDTRPPKDSDLENSLEWCPFYLSDPFKVSHEPWTFCSKQQAGISHIMTHMVSDHGLICGRSSRRRRRQRYLTRYSSHHDATKGRPSCVTCSEAEHWSPEEINSQTHAGPSICLRCYENLGTKEDLYRHLHEPSLCPYQEDIPMRLKSRILFETFCSVTTVRKFQIPRNTSSPKDWARNRKMKKEESKRGRGLGGSATEPQSNSQMPINSIIQVSLQRTRSPLDKQGSLNLREGHSTKLALTTQSTQLPQVAQPSTPNPNLVSITAIGGVPATTAIAGLLAVSGIVIDILWVLNTSPELDSAVLSLALREVKECRSSINAPIRNISLFDFRQIPLTDHANRINVDEFIIILTDLVLAFSERHTLPLSFEAEAAKSGSTESSSKQEKRLRALCESLKWHNLNIAMTRTITNNPVDSIAETNCDEFVQRITRLLTFDVSLSGRMQRGSSSSSSSSPPTNPPFTINPPPKPNNIDLIPWTLSGRSSTFFNSALANHPILSIIRLPISRVELCDDHRFYPDFYHITCLSTPIGYDYTHSSIIRNEPSIRSAYIIRGPSNSSGESPTAAINTQVASQWWGNPAVPCNGHIWRGISGYPRSVLASHCLNMQFA